VNKQNLLNKIIEAFEDEIKVTQQSAQDAQAEAMGNENLPQSQYDNRALEASRLAEAQRMRAQAAQKKLDVFRQLKLRNFKADDPVGATALVKVLHDKDELFFFIGPQGAGTVVDVNGTNVEVITPQSPLGEALMDQVVGDTVVVETPRGEHSYEIVHLS
jgi:transcription elongation GreA/GreB family factor